MTKTYIVTVATHDDYYLPYLKKTCKNNGSELIILGYGQKWEGFHWRQKLVLSFLENLNNNDIVCFVDGFDVICTRNLNQFADNFIKLKNKHNCKIIVSENKIVNHDILSYFYYFIVKYYFTECNNKLLNAGIYAGQVKDLIEILKNINNLNINNKTDDQILLTKYCQNNLKDIYIDDNAELFLSLANPYKNIDHLFVYKNNNIYYNGFQPFFIHGNGETYLDNILIKMNIDYDYKNKIDDKLSKDYFKKLFFRIENSLPFIILLLISLILLIILIVFIIKKFIINNKKLKIKYKKIKNKI